MKRTIAFWSLIALAIGANVVLAQVMQPATNTPLVGCVEGRAFRVVNGALGCAPVGTPTVSTCGVGPSLSANATDFVGIINTGTGAVNSCTLNMTKLYSNPNLGCIAQTNSATVLASNPVVGTNGTVSTLTITLGLGLPSGKVFYICAPV